MLQVQLGLGLVGKSSLSLVAEAVASCGFSSSCLLTKARFSLGSSDMLEGKFEFSAL